MPKKIRIWNVHTDDGESELQEVSQASIELEDHLEQWLEEDITILDNDLLVIGRQVKTDFGGAVDLLCLDQNGDLVIVELKRGKTPRKVVAQALDYASWGVDLSRNELETKGENYLDQSLEDAFREAFDAPLPQVLNEEHRLLIVGAEIDAQSERIIEYLSDEHGVNVNAATFQYFEDEEAGSLLARTFLIEPSQVEYRTQKKGRSKRKPDLTHDQLREIAEENGVGDWYQYLKDEIGPHFKTGTTRSSLAFKANLRSTRFEKGRGVVFSLIPTDSSEDDGLKFQIYTYRLAALCDVDPEKVERLLPDNWTDWQYANESIEDEWSGAEGYFTEDQEVRSFVDGIRELLTGVEEI